MDNPIRPFFWTFLKGGRVSSKSKSSELQFQNFENLGGVVSPFFRKVWISLRKGSKGHKNTTYALNFSKKLKLFSNWSEGGGWVSNFQMKKLWIILGGAQSFFRKVQLFLNLLASLNQLFSFSQSSQDHMSQTLFIHIFQCFTIFKFWRLPLVLNQLCRKLLSHTNHSPVSVSISVYFTEFNYLN